MKKILLLILLAGIVVAIIFLARGNSGSDSALQLSDDQVTMAVEGDTLDAGVYAAYSDDLAVSYDKTVLFFKAAWCSTCRRLDRDILENQSAIPVDVAILHLDYDTELDMRRQYGVTIQHTLVQIDTEGNLLNKWSGSPNLEQVLGNLI